MFLHCIIKKKYFAQFCNVVKVHFLWENTWKSGSSKKIAKDCPIFDINKTDLKHSQARIFMPNGFEIDTFIKQCTYYYKATILICTLWLMEIWNGSYKKIGK